MAGSLRLQAPAQSPRAPLVRETPASRGSADDAAEAIVDRVESPGTLADQASRSGGAEVGRALADLEGSPTSLRQIVEEANAASEVLLRAQDRSIHFGIHEATGRVLMTIKEQVDGEEVSRQIPPETVLKVIEQLRTYVQLGESPEGSLVDVLA